MSKVAIKGNASGTGTFTLEAPNSNTDRTLVLPDEAGTVLTSGTDVANFPSGFANGITEADAWRLTANKNGSGLITANLERVDDASFAKIGTGMTESSGVFSFPSTGLYRVEWHLRGYNPSASDYMGGEIEVSADGGSNWDIVVQTFGAIVSGLNGYCGGSTLVNVTSTSNFKVRFDFIASQGTTVLQGETARSLSHFLFTRLGDSQ